MLFDSNFSFAPRLSPPRERVPASVGAFRCGEIVGSGNDSRSRSSSTSHDLPQSPHSIAIALPRSRSRSQAAHTEDIKQLHEHPVLLSSSCSTAPSSPVALSTFDDPNPAPLTSTLTPLPSIVVDELLHRMNFFKRRSAYNSNDNSNASKHFYSSAVPMDLKHAKPTTISVPPRKGSRKAPSQPSRQPPPYPISQQQRPPVLRLEPSSRPLPAGKTQEINHSLLSPLDSKRSRQTPQTPDPGIQMLLNTLHNDSDDSDDECPSPTAEATTAASLTQLPRPETPMPAIDEERSDANSETSSISDSIGPTTPISSRFNNRRYSTTSTVPTSISEGSTYSYNRNGRRRCSIASSNRLSFNEDDFPTSKRGSFTSPKRLLFNDDDFTAPMRGAISEAPSLSSRRSSAATFFCRGNRNSVLNRNSIGLGSIATSDIDLEEGLENNTYFPGMEELKKQISWLALHGCRSYESEEEAEDAEDESEDYHQHLTSMVPPKWKASTKAPAGSPSSPMPIPTFPLPPTGVVMQTPPPRRARRRTASSECIVLETLEEMRLADQKAPTPSVSKVPKPKSRHATNNPRITGDDAWETALVGDTKAWDRMLNASDFNLYV